ncbi:MAG: hypothetical protein IPJ74_05540 [Saprospiraceae bacterium]|nr:hypothetical protein [Saprospiraceae bacterium]
MINGMTYEEAVPTLIKWLEEKGLGKGKIQYRIRNAVFSRQRYWGEPVPVYWKDDVPYLIEESELPLVLPQVDKYLPTETGEPPLGRAEDWKYPHKGNAPKPIIPRIEYHARLGWLFLVFLSLHGSAE